MPKIIQVAKTNIHFLGKVLPLIAIIIPFVLLYSLDPASFEKTWKGRTFYIFFLWLISLETILNWEEVQTDKIKKLKSMRTVAFILVFLMPTIYVVATNYYGVNAVIVDLAKNSGVYWADVMPLSTEYLFFTALFALIILLEYGVRGLSNFSVSTFFLGTIGMIYTIDNLYLSRFTPFQIIVPTTATLAANLLNLMGYRTSMDFGYHPLHGSLPVLDVLDSQGRSLLERPIAIAWPCSGVDSLLIYSVTILLFLKNTAIPWKHRIIYFIIGALVTYFINILRIVTFFIIAINRGDIWRFHDYYGPLYSIMWIISYPLIIIGSRVLWGRIRNWKPKLSK